jgi:hypothetical protein
MQAFEAQRAPFCTGVVCLSIMYCGHAALAN